MKIFINTGEYKAKDSLIKSAEDKNADLMKKLSDANQSRDKLEKSLKNYENSKKSQEGNTEGGLLNAVHACSTRVAVNEKMQNIPVHAALMLNFPNHFAAWNVKNLVCGVQ